MPHTHLQVIDDGNRHCPHSNIRDNIQGVEGDHELESIDTMTCLDGDIPILSNWPATEDESECLSKVICGNHKAQEIDKHLVSFDGIHDP